MERGLKKLEKGERNCEIVIRTNDKSKRLCISSYESYIRQGNKHVGFDREIHEEEVRSIQQKVNTTTRALVKIFRLGEGI